MKFNWNKIISIHKEIVKRGEDNFFSIPLNENQGFRSACFQDKNLISTISGPWQIDVDDLNNSKYINSLEAKQLDQFFLGGPLLKNKNSNNASPLIYREVSLNLNKNNVSLSPLQSKWLVSPPLVREILKYTFLDDFDDWILEKLEFLKNDKFNSQNLVEVFFEDFPFLKDAYFPDNQLFSWALFSPHSKVSPFNIHLMRDYERMTESAKKDKGGLSIFESLQKTKTDEMDIIPLVELNSQQKKSVKSFLSGNKLSVVTGPPGTGKSQVVLSTLLNAWAEGKTVLFSSSNNTAVDVIKERLDNFDSNTPLYIRAGSRERNNIQDVLKTVLMHCQEPEDINLAEIKEKQKNLISQIERVKNLIESDKPKQITELYLSAEKAYSEYLGAKSRLSEIENEIYLKKKNIFLDPNLEIKQINNQVANLKEWFEAYLTKEKEFKEANELLASKKNDFETDYTKLEKVLEKNGFSLSNIQDLKNIDVSSPENFKKLNEDLDNHLNNLLLEEDLINLENPKLESQWNDQEELNSAYLTLEQLKEEIDPIISEARKVKKNFEIAKKKLDKSLEKAVKANLKEDVKTNAKIFEEWQEIWFEQSKNTSNIFSKIPFTGSYKNEKLLNTLESKFIKDIPKKTLKTIQGSDGKIDRFLLSELVEVLEEFSSNKAKYKDSEEKSEKLRLEYEYFLSEARKVKVATKHLESDVDWLELLNCVDQNLKDIKNLKKAYSKLEKSLSIQKKVRDLIDEIFSLRMKNYLIKAWFKSDYGKDYENVINQLKKKSSHINARNFQDVYRRKSFFSFIDDWKSSLDLFFVLEETNKDIARLSSISNFEEIMDIFPSKYFIKPSINGYEETPRIFNFITDVENLIKNIKNFEDTLKDEIIGESKIEITRAVNQLQEAALLLDEDSQNKINEIVLKIENTEYQDYPKQEIAQAFDKFNEPMLKAKLESLNVDLASLSFQKARFNWSKKISNDQNLQNSIAALSRKLNYSKGVIDEKSFVDFKRALKAIPIWISTAQSSQSIPMIPGLFDIVIIDEASQCTVTNALPLVYRGKSLAIIGDPEQLTSIPSIQREEENSIFEQFSYDNFPDNLRHFGNNIYAAGFMNLFQASKSQIMLREHFRSHPLIIGFSNLNIYFKKYKTPLEIKKADKYSEATDGMFYFQVSGSCKKPNSGSSWVNKKEANKVINIVKTIKNKGENKSLTIGIVTPFKKQSELIIESLKEIGIAGIDVGTAHVYQGQEKDIMIFSTVVSHGIDPSAAAWISNPPNVLNVAMTRAKRRLLIVGDMDYCEDNFGGEILGRLAKYCKKIDRLNKISKEQKKLFELLILNGIEPEIEYPISDMHVDFYIPKVGQGLVIEVDGTQHGQQKMLDESRDATLRSLNNKVLRFDTRDVRETPTKVIASILKELN